jgi:murein DD-endopeptidase MepM/ murein hydrolase activator NlpD
MRLFNILLILISVISCSSITRIKSLEKINKKPVEIKVKRLKEVVYQIGKGQVKLIKLNNQHQTLESLSFKCSKKPIPILINKNNYFVMLSESYFSKNKKINCRLLNKENFVMQNFKIKVVPINYPKERLKVNKKHLRLSRRNLMRVKKEQKILNKIYKSSSLTPYFENNFLMPLQSKITSYYGMRRVYNNFKSSSHLGIDLRAKIGTKIRSSNSGKVVLAKHLFYTGNTVIIDHGVGIFSVYGHLSKLLVKENEILPLKSLIALSGATGRVSGPHLHWGVKVHYNWIDGLSLLKEKF